MDDITTGDIAAWVIIGGFVVWLLFIAWVDFVDEVRSFRATMRAIMREMRMK